MNSFAEVRSAVARFVGESGMCEDDPRIVKAVNEARRVLYQLGDWKDTVDWLVVCSYSKCFTLPNYLDYLISAWVCCQKMIVENGWFNRLDCGTGLCGTQCGKIQKAPGSYGTFRDWDYNARVDTGCCPPSEGFLIKLVCKSNGDEGKQITFDGIGANKVLNRVTRTLKGVDVANYAEPGENRFIQIKHVIKPITVGPVEVWGYDGVNEVLLAVYEQDDIDPSFARYYVPLRMYNSGKSFVIKGKKKYRPIEGLDTDLVDINIDALIHALQAITERENRNIAGYNTNLTLATQLLNKELGNPLSTSTFKMRWKLNQPQGLVC